MFNCVIKRRANSGHIVALTTEDPGWHAISSFELLDMPWALHRIAILHGAPATEDDSGCDPMPAKLHYASFRNQKALTSGFVSGNDG